MFPTLVSAWFSLILGCFCAFYPGSFFVWAGLFAMFIASSRSSIVALFFILGLFRMNFELLQAPVATPFNVASRFHVRVVAIEKFSVRAEILEGQLKSKLVRIGADEACVLGCVLEGEAKLFPLGEFRRARILPAKQIHQSQNLIGRLKWNSPPKKIYGGYRLTQLIRKKIFSWIATSEEPLHGFRPAILLGDTNGIESSVWKSMNYLGLSHLLVISGSHLSFIILCLIYFQRKIFSALRSKRILLARFILILSVSGFYFIANSDLSLSRAWLMCLTTMGAAWILPFLHRYNRTDILAAIGIAILFFNPYATGSTTYFLSFGATFALLQPNNWPKEKISKAYCLLYPYFVLSPLCFSLGLAVHPLSPLFNFLLLPIFGFILIPISFLSVVFPTLEFFANGLLQNFFKAIFKISVALQKWTPPFSDNYFLGTIFTMIVLLFFLHPRLSFQKRMLALSISNVLLFVLRSI